MRDYYSLLKHIKAGTKSANELQPKLLNEAIARNFGAKPDSLREITGRFLQACLPAFWEAISLHSLQALPQIPRIQLIADNLASSNSEDSGANVRHLMVLSLGNGDSALNLLFGSGVISEESVDVLVGSRFKDDLRELHMVQQINSIKKAMASGRTVVLLNNSGIYESLYDVLNQVVE